MANSSNNGMLNTISNIFSNGILKDYSKKWRVVGAPRKFNQQELDCIESCETHMGDYGLSICFHFIGKEEANFITVDPHADIQLGDTINPADLQIKMIENVGITDNPKTPIGYRTLRVELAPKANTPVEATDFNNPFGI